MYLVKTLIILFCVISTGCITENESLFSPTSEFEYPKKNKNCQYRVTSLAPDSNLYVELGFIDVPIRNNIVTGGILAPQTLGEFKDLISDDVCREGGDLVLSHINGHGQYIKGVVFRRKE